MPRVLYLLRHGKSDWSENVPDFDRPLNARGRRAAGLIGHWMVQHDAKPERIVCSPAQRARQTAEKIGAAIQINTLDIEWDDRIYEVDVQTLLSVLADYASEPQSVMLIGHNPGFETLVRYLAGDTVAQHEHEKLMPTAALARLKMPAQWGELARGCAELESITRPKAIS